MFETIDLSNIARTEKDLMRIREDSSVRRERPGDIETLTNAFISVYGKTVSMIGYPEQNAVARAGIICFLKVRRMVQSIRSLRRKE